MATKLPCTSMQTQHRPPSTCCIACTLSSWYEHPHHPLPISPHSPAPMLVIPSSVTQSSRVCSCIVCSSWNISSVKMGWCAFTFSDVSTMKHTRHECSASDEGPLFTVWCVCVKLVNTAQVFASCFHSASHAATHRLLPHLTLVQTQEYATFAVA